MLDDVLLIHIRDTLGASTLYYGSAEGITPPYTVMLKVVDPEAKIVLCNDTGGSGQATFQFSGYAGGSGDAADSLSTAQYLQTVKNVVKDVKGVIGTDEKYRISLNNTSGVRVVGDGGSTLGVWGVLFETVISWESI